MPVRKLKLKTQSQNSKLKKEGIKVKKKTEVRKQAEKVEVSLRIQVLNTKGESTGSVTLPKELFGAKINRQLLAQAVRVYLANQRRGTVSTKTRGEVSGSSRKIYRQKGTGRARHGGIRSPIFVKGGVVFGPKPREFSLSLSKKMKHLALFSALSSKLFDSQIKILSGLEKIEPKTKEMVNVFKNIGIDDKKILLVTPKCLENVSRSARNIDGVLLKEARLLNSYDVLNNNFIVLIEDSIGVLEKTFLVK